MAAAAVAAAFRAEILAKPLGEALVELAERLERKDPRNAWVVGNLISREIGRGVFETDAWPYWAWAHEAEWRRLYRADRANPRWPGLHMMAFLSRMPESLVSDIAPEEVFFVLSDGSFVGSRLGFFTLQMSRRSKAFLDYAAGPGLELAIDAFVRSDPATRTDLIVRFFCHVAKAIPADSVFWEIETVSFARELLK